MFQFKFYFLVLILTYLLQRWHIPIKIYSASNISHLFSLKVIYTKVSMLRTLCVMEKAQLSMKSQQNQSEIRDKIK